MTNFTKTLQCIVPLVLGLYSLVQGGVLVMNEDPMIQLLGVGILLWLPGCAYYTWCGTKVLLPRTVTVPARPQRVESQLAA